MHLLSAHAALSLLVTFVVLVALLLLSVPLLVAAIVAVVAGPVVIYGFLSDAADRLEHWLTTMR